MLTRDQIEKIAADYLIRNDYPIVTPGRVTLAEDETDIESKEFYEENEVACVSFRSKYFDDPNPEYSLDPGIYMAFVNIKTGEVEVPPHM